MKTISSLALSALLLSSCATTNKEKRLTLTVAGIGAGAAIGATRPEEKSKNAVLYGSLIGVGAAIVSELLFDDERSMRRMKKETEELKASNEILKSRTEPRLEKEGSSLLSAQLPKDTRHLIKPGGWKRYRLDRWVQDEENENVWFRQTEMFEVIPPRVGSN